MDNEFILQDRIQKIRQIVKKYGEDNFYISFSGGKDSNVLSKLVDLALPNNQIPRVYCDTGIEMIAVRDFVKELAQTDSRVEIIKPKQNIKKMLDEEGYPFKSKQHSVYVAQYQRGQVMNCVEHYLGLSKNWSKRKTCPKILRYQFEEGLSFKVSDKCCKRLKTDPLHKWQRERDKPYGILGLMHEENGRRETAQCLAFKPNGKLKNFQPLVAVTKEWEQWFVDTYNVQLPIVYYSPYNLTRTGCVGCPFKIKLQQELDMYSELMPIERRRAEAIWKPVYDEYRRIGYRLKS